MGTDPNPARRPASGAPTGNLHCPSGPLAALYLDAAGAADRLDQSRRQHRLCADLVALWPIPAAGPQIRNRFGAVFCRPLGFHQNPTGDCCPAYCRRPETRLYRSRRHPAPDATGENPRHTRNQPQPRAHAGRSRNLQRRHRPWRLAGPARHRTRHQTIGKREQRLDRHRRHPCPDRHPVRQRGFRPFR